MQDDKEKFMQQLLDTDQQLKEEQFLTTDRDDLKAYEILYSTLKQEPVEGLSFSFKADLMKRIQVEKRRASDFKLYLIVSLVVLTGLIFTGFLAFSYRFVFASFIEVILKVTAFIFIAIFSSIGFYFVEKRYLPNN